jgi:hypothetical protein
MAALAELLPDGLPALKGSFRRRFLPFTRRG